MLNPICDCDSDSQMNWSITNEGSQHGLRVTCNSCKTSLTIPYQKFQASFRFINDRPAPKKKIQPKSTVDNVIDLFRSKK